MTEFSRFLCWLNELTAAVLYVALYSTLFAAAIDDIVASTAEESFIHLESYCKSSFHLFFELQAPK